jgi:hypothetical protein
MATRMAEYDREGVFAFIVNTNMKETYFST